MISLTCTNCKKVLQIDDAFAGGVCRCQFCGTIQTVPAKLKPAARPSAPAAAKPKTPAPSAATQPAPPGSSAVATVAPAEESPRETRTRAANPILPGRWNVGKLPILLLAGIALVLIIGMVIWLSSLKRHMPPP